MPSPRALLGSAVVAALLVGGHARASAPAVELEEVAAGGSLPRAALLSPDGDAFYVVDSGALDAHNVKIYDAHTLAPRGDLDVPGRVVDAVFSPADPTKLFLASITRDEVEEMDVKTRQRVHFVRLRPGTRPKAIAIRGDGRTLYVADWGADAVSQIDVQADYEAHRVAAGKNPRALVLGRTTQKLYVASFQDGTIDVFDVKGGAPQPAGHVSSCAMPKDLALSPDEKTLYVSCYRDSTIDVVDVGTGATSQRVRVGSGPRAIELSRDGRFLWSAGYGSASTVTVVDTHDLSASIFAVPGMDRGGAVAPSSDGHQALVAGWYDDHVYLVGFRGAGGHPAEAAQAVEAWASRPRHADPAP